MFQPQTEKIKKLYEHKSLQRAVQQIDESIFNKETNIYIDFANVYNWQQKLGWHIDTKRLYQFLTSFSQVNHIRFYQGTLNGDEKSEKNIGRLQSYGYEVCTKPVKIMKKYIDISSLGGNLQSDNILRDFITRPLLERLDDQIVIEINTYLQSLNQNGIQYLEDKKCNFDVEMGVDMILDCERENSHSYVLWTGDSDFADIVEKLINRRKNVSVFMTSNRISTELAQSGAFLFDIQKIKNFICRNREMDNIFLDAKQKGLFPKK